MYCYTSISRGLDQPNIIYERRTCEEENH